MTNDEGKIQCPKCKGMMVPNVTKYGCGGGASQRICPLCGKRIGRVKGVACCFIATAAYGTPYSEKVITLCDFRDNVLVNNALGRGFISFYYSVSPSIADVIRGSEFLKSAVRLILNPVIAAIDIFYPNKK